jgi:phage terminase Nu1 subunit (DNA packaging protein)
MSDLPLSDDEIAELVARHPLPEGVTDAVLNREELAEALAVSLNTVTSWLNDGMPAIETGRNGKAYELRLSHCFAWVEARRAQEDAARRLARNSIEQMRLALVGGKSGDSIEALDPKTRRDIMAAQREHEQMQAARNELLRRADVRDMLDAVFAQIRDTLDIAPDRIERAEPTLPPKAVELLVGICDDLIDSTGRRIEAFWRDRPERSAQYLRGDLLDA